MAHIENPLDLYEITLENLEQVVRNNKFPMECQWLEKRTGMLYEIYIDDISLNSGSIIWRHRGDFAKMYGSAPREGDRVCMFKNARLTSTKPLNFPVLPQNKNSLFCSCSGASKICDTGFSKYTVCSVCKKEKP